MQLAGVEVPSEVLPIPAEQAPAPPLAAMPLKVPENMGLAAHRYKVEAIFTAWLLHHVLASGKTDLASVVKLAVKLSCPKEVQELVEAQLGGELALPSRETLRKCTIRLGYLDLLWQRELRKSRQFCRALMADASPQGGCNFYAVLEDRVSWPLADPPSQHGDFADLAGTLERRHYSLSTLGYGSADMLMKSLNTQYMRMP